MQALDGEGTDVMGMFAVAPITNPITGVATHVVSGIPGKLFNFESQAGCRTNPVEQR